MLQYTKKSFVTEKVFVTEISKVKTRLAPEMIKNVLGMQNSFSNV